MWGPKTPLLKTEKEFNDKGLNGFIVSQSYKDIVFLKKVK